MAERDSSTRVLQYLREDENNKRSMMGSEEQNLDVLQVALVPKGWETICQLTYKVSRCTSSPGFPKSSSEM